MSEEIRVSRPMQSSVRSDIPNEPVGRGSGSKLPWIILALVVVVLIVLAVLFRDKFSSKSGTGEIKSAEYQAVFLTNGQVYFGKMSGSKETYVVLKDIFYLQVQNPPIQGSQQQQQQQQQAQPQLSLVKLGNELHGPVDEMHINREQILFYEDMKADGKVIQAIKEYKANPDAGKQAPAQQQGNPPAGGQQGGQPQAPVATPKATTPTTVPEQ